MGIPKWQENSFLKPGNPSRGWRPLHDTRRPANPIADFNEMITVESSALVSKAEAAIHRLNTLQTSALEPFAKLLLRSESIASSKIEGMQVTASELARAEIKIVEGARVGSITREVISNIEAMQVAMFKNSLLKT
jgi:Fic family protein